MSKDDTIKLMFNYEDEKLYWINEEKQILIPIRDEDYFKGEAGQSGFVLDPNNRSHWITFKIYDNNIVGFYKRVLTNDTIIYYRKLEKKKAITRWEFTESDNVEKKEDGKWGKKL